MPHGAKAQPAWENRFACPTHEQLRDAYNKQNGALFDLAHGALRAVPGLVERILWQDIPWNWAYTFNTASDAEHPVAYLIPDPAAVRIAVRMPVELAPAIKTSDLKAEVREAITSAKRISGASWPVFEIIGRARLEEVMEIVRRRLAAERSPAPQQYNGSKPKK